MKDYSLYEIMDMPNPNFPIKLHHTMIKRRERAFQRHWHEHIELLYFLEGEAVIECGQNSINASCGDLIVVNSNELHQCESLSDLLVYYCIIIDISLLLGQMQDVCQSKYISPIANNLILFKNKIEKDPIISECINTIIREYTEKQVGFELEIKSAVYHMLAILLRNYVDKVLSMREYGLREKNMEKIGKILKYIEVNYTESISTSDCAKMLNITNSHFCHLFKLITGKSLSSYVNYLRLKKAETLLKNTSMSITDIAFATGFNDTAYFTRLFKRYKNMPPSKYRNKEENL